MATTIALPFSSPAATCESGCWLASSGTRVCLGTDWMGVWRWQLIYSTSWLVWSRHDIRLLGCLLRAVRVWMNGWTVDGHGTQPGFPWYTVIW